MNADLVCKGGGIKGIALIGAICCFEEYGYTWKNVAGTSAGAIVSSLIAVGYTGLDLKEICFSLNFSDFNDKSTLQSIPIIGPFAGLLVSKGVYQGDAIEEFLHDKFKEKGKTKFKDISTNGKSNLKIIAADITRKKLLILPDDLVDYNIDPMEFEIAKAVRMSLSIPFYFNPVILKNDSISSYIVDGGLVCNFPIWIFDNEKSPRWPTFGLNLDDGKKTDSSISNTNLLDYMFDVIETALSQNEDVYLRDKDAVRIVNIPSLDINSTNFNPSKDEVLALYKSGYNSAKEFLFKWNFKDYLERYESKI